MPVGWSEGIADDRAKERIRLVSRLVTEQLDRGIDLNTAKDRALGYADFLYHKMYGIKIRREPGVTWDNVRGKWCASFSYRSKDIHVGYYSKGDYDIAVVDIRAAKVRVRGYYKK